MWQIRNGRDTFFATKVNLNYYSIPNQTLKMLSKFFFTICHKNAYLVPELIKNYKVDLSGFKPVRNFQYL